MALPHSVIGVWRIKAKGAPFAYHMFVFHSDGTMHQTNPPLGNTETSDTAGLGVWAAKGKDAITARFEEYRLAQADGATVTRGAVDFAIRVKDDALTGTCVFNIFDPDTGELLKGPLRATLSGSRVTLP